MSLMKSGPLRQLRYEMRCILANHPSLYLPLARAKRVDDMGATRVSRNADLVVEAFPRSGNTFAYFALYTSQKRGLSIAHHLHAPAQLIAAARWRIPALLVVRKPADAIISFVQREPQVSLRQALRNWMRFHNAVLPHHAYFLTATFDQVTTDFGAVIHRLNARFGLQLAGFQHTRDNVGRCFELIDARNAQRFGRGDVLPAAVARPTSHRDGSKAALHARLQGEPTLRQPLARANQLYAVFARLAELP